jgi:catechol 2,3-dioxygenase-like lactoylglutathione lyase family enzyme
MGIKIQDIAYVRFSAPDLEAMEAFLTEFGMVRAERTNTSLYMRGFDEEPFLHVTQRGEPGFLAAGFAAAAMKDLETLAREEKVSIDRLDGPGGAMQPPQFLKAGDKVRVEIDRIGAIEGEMRPEHAS